MNRFVVFLRKLTTKERSAHKLALSFCVGNYIAFSPYLFFHTVMVFIFSWAMSLNLAVTLATSYCINNPFTMIPVYFADYAVGYWLLYSVLKLDIHHLNPTWITVINNWLESKLGFKLPCFWSFFIGGNLLGLMSSVILYPIMKQIFTKISKQSSPPS